MLCPGRQKQHGMFCPGWQIFVGCFVRGVKKWHGMFCPGMFCSAPGDLVVFHANIKGADQPAHSRSLVSAFVFRYLDRIQTLFGTCKVSPFWLVSVAVQAGVSLSWIQSLKKAFLRPIAYEVQGFF